MRPHSLVDPGNPPHSPPSRAKAHPTRQRHRMVALAARASGRRTKISPQTKITTVVLGGLIGLGGAEFRLPLLISYFGFVGLEAVILNKATSLVVVASALPFRAYTVPFAEIAA